MKQTAVDWLVEKLDNNLDINHSWRTRQYIEQAKQMEKEQIQEAYTEGCFTESWTLKSSEEYYKENYEKL
jgi:hypothetical protein